MMMSGGVFLTGLLSILATVVLVVLSGRDSSPGGPRPRWPGKTNTAG